MAYLYTIGAIVLISAIFVIYILVQDDTARYNEMRMLDREHENRRHRP